MKNKKISNILICFGVVLIIASGIALAVCCVRKNAAAADVAAITAQIEKAMPSKQAGVISDSRNTAMPALEINGTDFIGLLEIQDRNIKLPIAASWDDSEFAYRPARLVGSVYDGTLIIGGKYEKNNFDFADKMDSGEYLSFTDMQGRVFAFSVKKISHSDNAKTQTLTSYKSDLTLFVKVRGSFLAVQCTKI